jgi:hypothetical protein
MQAFLPVCAVALVGLAACTPADSRAQRPPGTAVHPASRSVASNKSSPHPSSASRSPDDISVLNGSDLSCAASETAAALRVNGFTAEASNEPGPNFAATVIEYPPRLAAAARAVHAVASRAPLKPVPDLLSVTMIIGENGVSVDGVDFASITPTCQAATT